MSVNGSYEAGSDSYAVGNDSYAVGNGSYEAGSDSYAAGKDSYQFAIGSYELGNNRYEYFRFVSKMEYFTFRYSNLISCKKMAKFLKGGKIVIYRRRHNILFPDLFTSG
jgi:hypothetical protein